MSLTSSVVRPPRCWPSSPLAFVEGSTLLRPPAILFGRVTRHGSRQSASSRTLSTRKSRYTLVVQSAAIFGGRIGGSALLARQLLLLAPPARRVASTQAERKQAQKAAYDFYRRKQVEGSLLHRLGLSWLRRSSSNEKAPALSREARNVQVAWYVAAVVVGALGATYAAVPLYKVFCQTTGFGGTTQRVRILGSDEGEAEEGTVERVVRNVLDKIPITSARVHTWTDEEAAGKLAKLKPVAGADLLTVRFDTTVGDVLPWSFVPVQLDVKVVPGETALSFFRVTNHSDKAITGVATYNVHPPKVGLYFQKIQCFCFEEQRLLPGETVDMPVFFFIDPEFLQDPQVSYIRSITLSYTFFKTDEDDDDDDEGGNRDDVGDKRDRSDSHMAA